MLHGDAHFVIGSAHVRAGKPCQDYATAADLPNGAAYAIVADGCSRGGQTDVGARIVTLATAQAIREHWSTGPTVTSEAAERIGLHQRMVAATAQSNLGQTQLDMLATCLYVYWTPGGGFIHLEGDGVVAWLYDDGRMGLARFDWADNMPFYPAYASDYGAFVRAHGGDLKAIRLVAETWERAVDGTLTPGPAHEYSLGAGMRGITLPLPQEKLRCVAVFSDGVTQVHQVDWKEAVVTLLDFTSTRGELAKRQLIWYARETQKTGKGPVDDLAFAVIYNQMEAEA